MAVTLFQVRPEYYACLTLESLIAQAASAQGGPGVLAPPPLPQPGLDLVQAVKTPSSVADLFSTLQSSLISKPWLRWFYDVYRSITAVPPGGNYLQVNAPSIDETDIAWFGNGTIDGSTDPASFTATLTGSSRFGIEYTITNPGTTPYTGTPTLTVKDSLGNTNGASATAVITGGKLSAVIPGNSGYGLVPPLTVSVTGGGGAGATVTAQIGRQWGVGDYIIWNDPTIQAAPNQWQYEIDQLSAITYISPTSATFKLARGGGAAGLAKYGSQLSAHAGMNFYRLINKTWLLPFDPSAGPQVVPLLWPNMTVAAALVSQTGGNSSVLVNLAPRPYLPGTTTLDPRANPPCPGLRTMNGAAYTTLGVSGNLAAGATSVARVSAQAWESIRTIYAKVLTAPTGAAAFGGDANACIVIWVCWISPPNSGGTRTVGLLDVLVIDAGNFTSYPDGNAAVPNVPDGRQMPYHGLGQWTRTSPNLDFPPNWLPVCAGALDVTGKLQLPITPSGTSSVQYSPDGQIDFIISQVGSSVPGANLSVTAQN